MKLVLDATGAPGHPCPGWWVRRPASCADGPDRAPYSDTRIECNARANPVGSVPGNGRTASHTPVLVGTTVCHPLVHCGTGRRGGPTDVDEPAAVQVDEGVRGARPQRRPALVRA